MDDSALWKVAVGLLSVPLICSTLAVAMETAMDVSSDRKVGFFGYWLLCAKRALVHSTGRELAVQIGIVVGAFALASSIGDVWDAAKTGLIAIVVIFLFDLVRASSLMHEEQRAERINLRNERTLELHELTTHREHVQEMFDQISDNPDVGNTSIWVNAGQDLIESRFHGVLRASKYAALRSILNAAEKGGHAWQQRDDEGRVLPVLYGVFRTFVSWWEKRDVVPLERHGDLLRFGLNKFIHVIDERLAEIKMQLPS